MTSYGGHLCGTHFLWHALNALTIYLLLRAMIRYGAPPLRTVEVKTPPPDARTLAPKREAPLKPGVKRDHSLGAKPITPALRTARLRVDQA